MDFDKYTTAEQIKYLQEEIRAAKKKKSQRKRTIGKAVNYVGYFILLSFLAYLLITIQISRHAGNTPELFGYQLYYIKTGSMDPTLPAGAIILSKTPADSTSLEVGDIITFKKNNSIITHRIIEVIKGKGISYRTKGDSPVNSPDPEPVYPEEIKAVLIIKLY